MTKKTGIYTIAALLCVVAACTGNNGINPGRTPDESYNPEIPVEDFTQSTDLTNPYLGHQTHALYIYEGHTVEGMKRIEVQRTSSIKEISDIPCVAVNDKVWCNGIMIEETNEWAAQDNDGNVWLMGEDVDNYNDRGEIINHHVSWEAGIDGARPGIMMPANPDIGKKYRQEYYFNKAEDEAEVVEVDITVDIPLGSFSNCIKIREWTELEPDVTEYKYYAPGIGLIKEENVTEGEEVVLVDIRE